MKVILFRSRIRPGVDVNSYLEHANAMYEIASKIPGFISSEDFTSADGERLAVITFRDDESLKRWREHAEHRAAQARGRTEYYETYKLQVCDLEREMSFPS